MINTLRLVLRPPVATDAPSIFKLRSDPEVAVYLNRKLQTTVNEAEAFISNLIAGFGENKWHYWLVCNRDDGEFLGTICLWNFSDDRKSAEVGYELLPGFQGRGFATEALEAVLEYGFKTLSLTRIDAIVEKGNIRSKALLERFGFTVTKDFEEPSFSGGDHVTCLVFSLESSAYVKNQ